MMNILQTFALLNSAKQLFTKPESYVKEITSVGIVGAVISIYTTIQVSCATSCDLLLVSNEQWGALAAGVVVMYAHLRSKALRVEKVQA